jgi:hypothetical protein
MLLAGDDTFGANEEPAGKERLGWTVVVVATAFPILDDVEVMILLTVVVVIIIIVVM